MTIRFGMSDAHRCAAATVAKVATTTAAALAVSVVLVAAPAQATPKGDGITPQHAACGHAAPPNLDPISAITGAASGARIRTGSSTSCPAPGASEPSDRLDYYCYTVGNDGFTWTYLKNGRTKVAGWTRDDLLPGFGSWYYCGF